jgi:hypothetical protein
MTKCGWRDQSTASLNRWKKQLGLEHRNDVHTFFDLYDADEGRDIKAPADDGLRREALREFSPLPVATRLKNDSVGV